MKIPQSLFEVDKRPKDKKTKVPMIERAEFPNGHENLFSAVYYILHNFLKYFSTLDMYSYIHYIYN